MKILLVDHEDSFVYNLEQALRVAGARVLCVRSNAPWEEVRRFDADGFVLSPGPGHPDDRRLTRLSRRILREHGVARPILGVCLGHQLIGRVYGAEVVRAAAPVHGASAWVRHDDDPVYRGVPSPFRAARYHSLIVDRRTLPSTLVPNARTRDGTVMGMRHARHPVLGMQFHPESFLTDRGSSMLRNFLGEIHR